MIEIATLSDDFLLTVPDDVCQQQGWLPGERLAFVADGGGVRLVKVSDHAGIDRDPSTLDQL